MLRKNILLFVFIATGIAFNTNIAQSSKAPKPINVFGYYAGRPTMIDSFPVEKLTHLCFSFTHLKGNQISLGNFRDSLGLKNCVALKKRNPHMKVIVSLGGWTGCFNCSAVFSADSSRKIFASSVKQFLDYFKADGIDLDWEYPAIPGPPGHPYSVNDRQNFTFLIQTLRDTLGKEKEISFAAGGFSRYLKNSVEWDKVVPLVDRVNLMTYDLVSGYDTITGHHTPLYSNKYQVESCDHAIKMLKAMGVPASKLLIGAAFYARIWQNIPEANNGFHQHGSFYRGVSYRYFTNFFAADSGYISYKDKASQASYYYNPEKKWFVTYDDSASIVAKTRYAIKQHLDGIMFWQLADDSFTNGLLDVIDETKKKYFH